MENITSGESDAVDMYQSYAARSVRIPRIRRFSKPVCQLSTHLYRSDRYVPQIGISTAADGHCGGGARFDGCSPIQRCEKLQPEYGFRHKIRAVLAVID